MASANDKRITPLRDRETVPLCDGAIFPHTGAVISAIAILARVTCDFSGPVLAIAAACSRSLAREYANREWGFAHSPSTAVAFSACSGSCLRWFGEYYCQWSSSDRLYRCAALSCSCYLTAIQSPLSRGLAQSHHRRAETQSTRFIEGSRHKNSPERL